MRESRRAGPALRARATCRGTRKPCMYVNCPKTFAGISRRGIELPTIRNDRGSLVGAAGLSLGENSRPPISSP